MESQNRSDGIDVPPGTIAEITRLYNEGLYLQAAARATEIGPVAQWRGTDALLIGGRLANHLYAPRLSRWAHGRAWRRDRTSAEAAYYYGLTVREQRGPLAAWRFLRRLPAFADAPASQRADLLMMQAGIAGAFRDFDAAQQFLEEAVRIDEERPWLWVERGSLYEQQDAYDEALAATRQALALHPWFRPAIQAAAHQLELLGRDDEAVAMLEEAMQRMECAAIAGQLATLQSELGAHAESFRTWQRQRELAPWMEPKIVEWWEGRMSDAFYGVGDIAGAADCAGRAKGYFFAKLAERLRAPAVDARRVLLDVAFVRQHHFTCAPATLSALSRYWSMPVDHLALAAAICYDGTPDHVERHWALENGWHVREFCVTWEVLVALLDRGVPFTLTTVETQSAHLQAVIGYDSFRGTILIRDPYARTHREWLATEFFERYAANGPRGMLLIPPGELSRLEGVALPEAELYDEHNGLQRALHGYDREAAQRHLVALENAAPEHRLTLLARRSVAGYDGSLPGQLAAVEGLLGLHPKNGNFLWGKLTLLRHMGRRADYQEFLRERCADAETEPLFWREWASELSTDARRLTDAERLVERALCRQPLDPDNLHSRANLHWERREYAAATELYGLAASLRDKVDLYSRSYFIAARHLRQTDAALTLLSRRFEKFGGKSSQPVRLLFWALNTLSRQTEAFARLEQALALRPDDGELLLFAADALARSGDMARGSTLLQSAEKRVSRVAWLRTAASLADYRCDLPAALTLWREILAEEPLALDAQRAVTRLLGETEGRAAALAHLEETCARFGHHIGLHELWAEWTRMESNTAVEPVLRRLLALHPEYAWAHRELASVCSALHRPQEAAAELDIAQQLEPQSPSTPGIRAQVALEAGRLAEAREYARDALRLSVDYDYAIRTLLAASDTYEEKKAAVEFIRQELARQVVFGDGLLAFRGVAFEILEQPDLLDILQEAQKARPDLWHAWSAVAQQLRDMHRLDEALVVAREATERFPLLPRLWLDLAGVHIARREQEQGIPPLERALQLSPAWGQASRSLADIHQRLGRYDDAARVLERAIGAAPLDPNNHGCLADALRHLNRTAEAVTRLEHALKLEPDYEWAWEKLRAWSPEQGLDNRALRMARKLTTLRAGEARSWLILAQALPAEPIQETLDALDRATALHPHFADAHDARANVLADAGRYEEALAACSPPIYDGHPPTSLQGRAAWVEARRGNTRAAIAAMRNVVASAPDYFWGWHMLADWCTMDRDFKAAKEAARMMARLAPRSAIPLGYLADIQLQNGEESAAFVSLRQAFDIDPNYGFAGFTLFDRHIKEGENEDARLILEKLAIHLPGPRTQAAQVRLQARLGHEKEAFQAFDELLFVPDSGSPSLYVAVNALVNERWGLEVERRLAAVMDKPDVNPEIGAIWVQRCAGRGEWNACNRIFRIPLHTELGRRARIAFIEAVGEHGKRLRLWFMVRRERAALRESVSLWGSIGYAYIRLRDYGTAVKWLKNGERRKDVQPWILNNLAVALRELDRDPEALAANRRALALPQDHTISQHRLWVALETALAGYLTGLDAYLSELREHALNEHEERLLALIQALQSVHRAPAQDRARIYREQRKMIADRVRRGEFSTGPLDRARRRSLVCMGHIAGDRWRNVRAWFQRRRPSENSGRNALIVLLMLAMPWIVRSCVVDSDFPPNPPSTPARPVATPRLIYPITPTPGPLEEPTRLELFPSGLGPSMEFKHPDSQ